MFSLSSPQIPITEESNEMEQSWEMSPSELLVNMGTGSLEEFYPSVAIATLMRIVHDPTLSQHHTEVVQAVAYIFMALGIKSVPYIPQVSLFSLYIVVGRNISSLTNFHDTNLLLLDMECTVFF